MNKTKKDKYLFFAFVFFSLLAILYVIEIFPEFLSRYAGYKDESVSPTKEVARETIKYILPVCIGYILIILSYILLKVKGYFKWFFPILFITLLFLLLGMAETYQGASAVWILVMGIIFYFYLLPFLFTLGKKIDNRNELQGMKEVIEELRKRGESISTMESCTGGYIVNEITNIEGASEVLKYSAVTYSNEYKIKMGVSKEVIDTYSVYSMETARSMAKAISIYTDSTYAIGITGKLNRKDKANESGKDNQVFIAIYDKKKNTYLEESIFVEKNTRTENKRQVFLTIVSLLKKYFLL